MAWRLIFGLRRSDHVSDALISLHWLRIPQRIQFKVAVLTYKATSRTSLIKRWISAEIVLMHVSKPKVNTEHLL